ncbi:MAG TPA: lysylphosphatidylglycerol synthase domain-containing protein [Alphaproteobacteria bacterium]|nr:lysylphosphatidylglycerol synthase domain-containing protein [Alphaproteobacteria bacterium]
MKFSLGIAMLAGFGLAAGLIIYQGAGQVLGMLLSLGWGFVPVVLVHVIQMLGSALGWRVLIPRPWPRPLLVLLKIRWIREGANALLPVAHIGGEIIGARMLSFHGVRGDVSGASVVVDLTVEIVTQVLFTVVALALLLLAGHGSAELADVVTGVAIGAIAIGGFVIAQRVGLFMLIEHALDRMMEKAQWLSIAGIKGLHDAIQAIHRNPKVLAGSAAWHFLSWMLGGGEVWLILHFMGIDVGLREALILESLGQAAHSAGFMVPGAIGIQEGGLMVFGALLGVSPEAALGLSLVKRLRELVLGVPAIALWQWVEGRRLIGNARTKAAAGEN